MALLTCLTLLILLQGDPGLRDVVRDYWDALEAGDKARAMRHVHPEDLNKFLSRHEPFLQDWEIEELVRESEVTVAVTVTFRRLMPGGTLLAVRAEETWERTHSGWKVRVRSEKDLRDRSAQSKQDAEGLPPRLDVLPKVVRIPRQDRQPGVIVIRNGLESAVRVVGLSVEEPAIRVTKSLSTVPSRSVGRMALRYVGESTDPDQATEALLTIEVDGSRREFRIPIVFNSVDPIIDRLRRLKPKG